MLKKIHPMTKIENQLQEFSENCFQVLTWHLLPYTHPIACICYWGGGGGGGGGLGD